MDAPAKFVCMCGVVHALPRERALDGLSVAHWRCTDCGRRFVLTHTPPSLFTPIYLDGGVRSIEPRETGSAAGRRASLGNPVPPPAIEFPCRCGTSITAHSWMYGASIVCPGCQATLLAALRYSKKRKEYVIVPEYPVTSYEKREPGGQGTEPKNSPPQPPRGEKRGTRPIPTR